VQSFFEWFAALPAYSNEKWLILGKGPSFAKRHNYDLGSFKTVALNHAVREQAVTLSHVIDFDVLHHCGESIENNAEALVMPWIPHVNNKAGEESLEELLKKTPLLRRLSAQGRLLWYNLSTASQRHGDSPVVKVQWFSVEAVLNLLALAGVRQVRSLGIDGGRTYSGEFEDLKDKTLLANKHESFDRQFAEIARIIARTGIDYAPLDVDSPIRVYVGATEEQMLAVKVLEYSIRKHTTLTVALLPLHRAKIEVPMPKDPENAPRTPFSFQRFLIPALAGYRGRAIYLDSDMQVFKDLRHLWSLPFDGAELLSVSEAGDSERPPQFSVMLLDCEALRWDINEIVELLNRRELTYQQLVLEMAVARNTHAAISPNWNSLEYYREGQTALVHYTDMPTQPWVSRDNPLGYLWVRDLLEAIDDQFITVDFVKEHVAHGWVRPSLLYQIEHAADDSLLLPASARRMDFGFVPPYQQPGNVTPAPRPAHFLPWLRATRRVTTTLSQIGLRRVLQRLKRRVR
jgi:hypothetical protein